MISVSTRLESTIYRQAMKFNTLAKAIEIFDLFKKERDALSVNELADYLRMPRSTAYAYLAFLTDSGLLDNADERGKYRLGLKFLDYGSIVKKQIQLTSIALPYMRKLSKSVESTVLLTVRREGYSYVVEKVEHDSGLVLIRNIGDRRPLYCGASSKIHLANMKDEEIQEYLGRTKLRGYTKKTITNSKKLLENVKQIRRSGYAFSDQEGTIGTRAVAAPIRRHEGEIIASVCVAGPTNKITGNNLKLVANEVISCARAISKELNYNAEL
jgi:IclR family KDG regulon transcriptional repressor